MELTEMREMMSVDVSRFQPVGNLATGIKAMIDSQVAANMGKTLIEKKIFSAPIDEDSDYAYCPLCMERAKRADRKNWKPMATKMLKETWKYLVQVSPTVAKPGFETRYFCPNCKKHITYEDCMGIWFFDGVASGKAIDPTKVDVTDPEFIRNF